MKMTDAMTVETNAENGSTRVRSCAREIRGERAVPEPHEAGGQHDSDDLLGDAERKCRCFLPISGFGRGKRKLMSLRRRHTGSVNPSAKYVA